MDVAAFAESHAEFVWIDHEPHLQQTRISCSRCGHLIRQGGVAPSTQFLHMSCNHCSVNGTLVLDDDCRHILGYLGDFDFTAL
jgi:ribosomal protein S27E